MLCVQEAKAILIQKSWKGSCKDPKAYRSRKSFVLKTMEYIMHGIVNGQVLSDVNKVSSVLKVAIIDNCFYELLCHVEGLLDQK